MDEKLYENILIYDVEYKTSYGEKSLSIISNKYQRISKKILENMIALNI